MLFWIAMLLIGGKADDPSAPVYAAVNECIARAGSEAVVAQLNRPAIYSKLESDCEGQLKALHDDIVRVNREAGVSESDGRINASDTVKLTLDTFADQFAGEVGRPYAVPYARNVEPEPPAQSN